MRLIVPTRVLCRVSYVGLAVLGVVSQAAALPVYPGLIDRALNVDCGANSSRCLACHATAAGGRNTATRPFAVTLSEDFGFGRDSSPLVLQELLKASDPNQGAMPAAGTGSFPPTPGSGPPIPGVEAPVTPMITGGLATTDSDGDGDSDIDELLACGNPSGDEYGIPEYGCDGGSFTGNSPGSNTGWAGVLILALAGWVRSRKKSQISP